MFYFGESTKKLRKTFESKTKWQHQSDFELKVLMTCINNWPTMVEFPFSTVSLLCFYEIFD